MAANKFNSLCFSVVDDAGRLCDQLCPHIGTIFCGGCHVPKGKAIAMHALKKDTGEDAMIGYRPEYFELHEVLPRDFYMAHYPKMGERLWLIFDPFILCAGDALRAKFGKMVCNTWYWGGNNQYRGYRPPGCSVGADLSMHRFGRALDFVPLLVSAAEIRDHLKMRPDDPICQMIGRIEDGVDWLHIDRGNVPGKLSTYFFKP